MKWDDNFQKFVCHFFFGRLVKYSIFSIIQEFKNCFKKGFLNHSVNGLTNEMSQILSFLGRYHHDHVIYLCQMILLFFIFLQN